MSNSLTRKWKRNASVYAEDGERVRGGEAAFVTVVSKELNLETTVTFNCSLQWFCIWMCAGSSTEQHL